MFPECDNCEFYGVGDTCDECRKRRYMKKAHRDNDAENYNDGDYEYDDNSDDEYNL